MRKYCSQCNEPLLLSHPKCLACGAENPYYKPEFAILQQPATDETERIQQQLEKLQQEANLRESELRNEIAELQNNATQQNHSLQTEITNLREQLQMLVLQNEQLRQQAAEIHLTNPATTKQSISAKSQKSSSLMWLWLLPLLVIPLFAWVYTHSSWKKTTRTVIKENPVVEFQEVEKTEAEIIEVSPITQPDTEAVVTTVTEMPKASKTWQLTESSLIKDVVGKRISGCDVQVQNSSDIKRVENLVLVERINGDLYKYKCRIEINRNGNSYVATPYIYYRQGGTFVKIDGSNCEQVL